MSFKDFISKDKITEDAMSYYDSELKQLLPIDEYGISFQMKAGNKSTKWITLNRESIISLENFLNYIKQDNKEIR
jgi:hypothetical protein